MEVSIEDWEFCSSEVSEQKARQQTLFSDTREAATGGPSTKDTRIRVVLWLGLPEWSGLKLGKAVISSQATSGLHGSLTRLPCIPTFCLEEEGYFGGKTVSVWRPLLDNNQHSNHGCLLSLAEKLRPNRLHQAFVELEDS